MIQKYLTGLSYEHCAEWDKRLSGWYVATRGNGTYYYFGTYNRLQNRKKVFFELLKEQQSEVKREWERHHIVERQHLKYFYSDSTLKRLYYTEWPCVMIHKGEHFCYSSLLHHKESRLLFLEKSLNQEQLLSNIKDMYRQAYTGNPILSKISQNILRTVTPKRQSAFL